MTKTEASAIRPFHVSFPEADLTDLRRRVNAKMARAGNGGGCNARRPARDDFKKSRIIGAKTTIGASATQN